MKVTVTRRSLLAGVGYAAACGSVAGQVLSVARAAEGEAPAPAAPAQETVLSMVFMAGPRSKFDTKKYTAKHLPLLQKAYGESVSRIELRTGTGQAMGIPSAILATTSIYIRDLGGFIQRMTASAAEINKDLEDSSSGTVVVQPDRLIAATGGPREEVRAGGEVFSTYFAERPGTEGTFDADYYVNQYVPQMISLYGENAIRRVEVNLGMVQGGQKPMHKASCHVFIRDRPAYDEAGRSAFGELIKLSPKYTTIQPMWADLRVTGVV